MQSNNRIVWDCQPRRFAMRLPVKDLDGYMGIFSSNLSYKQANGKEINWEQLKKDVAPQLTSAQSMESSYVREKMEVNGSEISEVLTQTATYEIKVFLFFKRKWQVHRQGRYTWSKTDNKGWQITSVEVTNEKIRRCKAWKESPNKKMLPTPDGAADLGVIHRERTQWKWTRN